VCHAGIQASPIVVLLAADGGSISTISGHVNCGGSGAEGRAVSGDESHPEPITGVVLQQGSLA
jgi:hypothetical protein